MMKITAISSQQLGSMQAIELTCAYWCSLLVPFLFLGLHGLHAQSSSAQEVTASIRCGVQTQGKNKNWKL
jgi:hypothetical protein